MGTPDREALIAAFRAGVDTQTVLQKIGPRMTFEKKLEYYLERFEQVVREIEEGKNGSVD